MKEDHDVVLSISGLQSTKHLRISVLKWLRKKPFVFEVRIYGPMGGIEMGKYLILDPKFTAFSIWKLIYRSGIGP